MADAARKRLGKGLSALLGDAATAASPPPVEPAAEGAVREIPVERCSPNPHQPRERFDSDSESALLASVREHGVLQPILVTPDERGGYRIVAGERRWRAARGAGRETIPAVVKRLGARDMVELALVENLQREDLNAIEEAKGYRELTDDFGMSHAEIAERVGKDRSTVANALRLLELPADVQGMIEDGRLAMAHGRALLSLEDPAERLRMASEAVSKGLSVRQVEAAVRRARDGGGQRRGRSASSPQTRFLEGELQRALGTRVRVVERRRGAGVIEVSFGSAQEFERLNDLLLGRHG
ncbi:MAG: ParB/RepB/Spo0J family partition protein [Gemmatimonadota bacterium]